MVASGGGGACRIEIGSTWTNANGGFGGTVKGGKSNSIVSNRVSYTNPAGGTQISGGLSVNNESNDYIGHFGKANIKAGANSTGAGGGYYGGASNNLIGYAMFFRSRRVHHLYQEMFLCDAINESSSENSITHKRKLFAL